MNRLLLTLMVAAVMLVAASAARASGEHSNIKFPSGAFAINPVTCVFLHREVDRPVGSSWMVGRVAFQYEDGRHDALDNCLRRRLNQAKTPAPDTCWTAPPPVAEAKADKRGYHDTRGLVALQAWAASVAACEAARNA